MLHFYPSFWGFLCFYRKIIAKSDRLNEIILIFATSYQKSNVETETMMQCYPHTVTSMCTMIGTQGTMGMTPRG